MQNSKQHESKIAPPMSEKVARFRYLALASHLGLLAWMAIWYFILLDTMPYPIGFILVMYMLPLLLPLHGIIKAKPYTHAWSCFIVLWYFLHGFTVLYVSPDETLYASIELVLASGMFVGCSMFARYRGQELGTSLPKLSKVMEAEKERFEGTRDEKY